MNTNRVIAVIGAGLMGHGIALSFARAGHAVHLSDPSSAALESAPKRIRESMRLLGADPADIDAALGCIVFSDSLAEAVREVDIVFEAAPEKLPLKQDIFAEVEMHAPTDAILASNTSVIQITKIMSDLTHRERAIGTHWWNPPHMIPLVEVVRTQWTEQSVAEEMRDLLDSIGKTAVIVDKDVPGFIGNRLQHALWREAISLVENGVCDAEAVDTVIKASFGRRLAVLGPLENADLIGTDLTLDIHENVLCDLESRQAPSPYLRQLIDDGRLGMKSGRGFRDWETGEADTIRERVGKHLRELDTLLQD